MSNKFFNKKDNRRCCCCENSIVSEHLREVFCTKKGVMDPNDCCRKFKYDVLKRIPNTVSPKKDFKKEDFSID